jgi:flavin-dependent dehydrogenase
MSDLGEMHVRTGYYIGVAPVPGSLVNVCVVTRRHGGTPLDVIKGALARDPDLRGRFADARFSPDVRVLGPLAADAVAPGMAGLVLAGDAAGFIDPMTGDGLHQALEGARLAAEEVARTLTAGDFSATIARLAAARRRVLGPKLRFNRALRALVDSPGLMRAASLGARVAPGLIQRTIRMAGDVS